MKNRRKRSLLLIVILLCALVVQGYAGQQPTTVQEEALDTVWVRQYHDKTVYDIAFSPDGSLIASSSRDMTLKLVQTSTGQLVRSIQTAPFQGSLSFSPDGRYIASGGSSKAYIWEVATGELVRTIDEHKIMSSEPEIFIDFSPDGRFFITSGYDKLVLWNAVSGEKVYEIDNDYNWRTVSFSPDSRTMVLGLKGTVMIADIETGTVRKSFTQAPVSDPFYTPDGASIAVRYKYTDLEGVTKTELLFLDTTDFHIKHTIEFGTSSLQRYLFSPGGAFLVAISNNVYIDIWNVEKATRNRRYYFNGPFHIPLDLTAIALAPDSQYIASSMTDDRTYLSTVEWTPGVEVGVVDEEIEKVTFYPPYPHPSEDVLQFRYNLASAIPVELSIVDTQGRKVTTLVQQTEAAGEHIVRLQHSTELPTGQYFCRLLAGHHTIVQPFIISR